MKMGEKIRDLRINRGYSQEYIAEILNTTKQAIYKYENSIVTNIPMDKIEALAKIFSVSPSYLMGWDNDQVSGVKIPVYGSVAAGIPIRAITDIDDYEEIPNEMAIKGEYIALRIHGTSMEPRMTEGDIVIVRLQDDVDSGETAIVMVNGDDATCKRVKKTPNGIILISTNPAFEPIMYTNKEIEELPIRILGKVVELRAKY